MTIKDEDLITAATDARENAYCHYSGYSVGAAIIDDQGRLHVGCNVENAAYPLGNCAEAAAIAAPTTSTPPSTVSGTSTSS